jgi:hypothetical protein
MRPARRPTQSLATAALANAALTKSTFASRLRVSLLPASLVLVGVATSCGTLGSIAAEGVDFAGATADAHCDRRFVTGGGQAAAFCQELAGTVAAAEFSDDCRAKHRAAAGTGGCPRARILGGCKILKKNDDDSIATDWYYDVSELVAEAGATAGPDGGPTFDSVPKSTTDVRQFCSDATRYENGAEFVSP